MKRIIEAPDHEWLDIIEVANWFGVSAAVIHEWVDAGRLPSAVALSRKNARWHWEVVWAASALWKHGWPPLGPSREGSDS